MSDDGIKKLPFSMIAEQSLLGSVLIDPESFNEIADFVTESDFYINEHAGIFTAMHELFLINKEIDIVTLVDMLVMKGIYDKSGGESYIRTLSEVVPSALNVKDYANIVREKSVLRQLIEVCGDISETAYSEQEQVGHILDDAESRIFAIAQGRDTKNFRHIRDLMVGFLDNLHEISNNPDLTQGTATGFSKLDTVLAGMGNSDLVLIGARPGMGKTSLALNIGTNVAMNTKKNVCIFSLEMSAEQLCARILSSEAMVDNYALRTGNLKEDDWSKLVHASSRLSGCNILIDDTSGITVTGMKAKLRRIKNLGLVIVDYLQLMQSDRRIDNRVQEVGDISRALKLMAKEFAVPVICCAQLSRGPESRTSKKPMLADLRDSGAIEQDADVVMFIYRDDYYNTDKDATASQNESNIAELLIAKNRHGSTGEVKVGWVKRFTKFVTIDDTHSEGG